MFVQMIYVLLQKKTKTGTFSQALKRTLMRNKITFELILILLSTKKKLKLEIVLCVGIKINKMK